jgi:alkyl sulfatase BDS1-like metallo-beta-lactamase superfamily hydrolase
VAAGLPLADRGDFDAAERGLIARDPDLVIRAADGRVVWNMKAFDFVHGEAPASVNPSLWRQAQLNNRHGLFEVVDGIYQVRGYDLSNMSLIRGRAGWIVVDPLTSRETATAALAMARAHLGDDPIVAVILTHSHIDHFGGIRGVVSEEDVASGKVRVIAPLGFVEEATSENVLAGVAMGRRASFMYGFDLERSPRGHVDSGLGKSPARGEFGVLPPTDLIDRTPQPMEIDGVHFVFQYAPESEAPAELTFYLPDRKTFCGAEVVSRNMHNLYTLRGAKVRDALKWSGYIGEAIHLFGDVEVLFASHHWPTWGNERVIDYLKKQRDTYKYIHDQTLRLANAGYTSQEIAEKLELPESLRTSFPNRGYYGTVRHNSKAVYQWYFGWYDGNPAHLNPLPPAAAATKYVEYMGGAAEVLKKARQAFERGEYRWVAMVLDHVVFADPDNREARELLAQTYDQLGYQAEAAPWRDVYLTAALELRHGGGGTALDIGAAIDLLRHMPVDRFFDSMAARIDGPAAEGKHLKINFIFTDLGESYVLEIDNAVLNYRKGEPDPDADVSLKLTREFWLNLATGQAGLRQMIFSDDLDVDGSRLDLLSFFSLMETPRGDFNIVTP